MYSNFQIPPEWHRWMHHMTDNTPIAPYNDIYIDTFQIPPEWHRWMHHMTDDTPVAVPPTPRKFFVDHYRNMSGTNDRYVPYSTTLPKVESWSPPTQK